MKKSVILSAILILVALTCVLAGCTLGEGAEIVNPDAVINGVKQISLAEYTTTYFLGQEFDYGTAKLKLLLESGAIKYINITKDSKTVSITGYNRFQVGQQEVTVKYGGKISSTFQVTVIEPDVKSVTIKNLPTKNIYTEGDRLDMSGAEILVTMTNGVAIDFPVDNSIVTGSIINADKEFVVTGVDLELNIRYSSKLLPFKVTVKEKVLTAVTLEAAPNKLEYYLNDSVFAPQGLKLRYTYNNGISQVVEAEAQTNLVYKFDFSVARTDSPVTVEYQGADKKVLFSVKFTVVVIAASYQSIQIVTKPTGFDSLIEGFSIIDYSTGSVRVTFADGTTKDYRMDAAEITKSNYDNTRIGKQSIIISYNNNTLNAATLEVVTNAKKVKSVQLLGVEEVQKVVYYEGQATPISIGKLYYIVTYNNTTTSDRREVTEQMLKAGSDLICTANGGAGGAKTIVFVIEGKEVSITVNINPRQVTKVEIVKEPSNLYVATSGAINPAGGIVNVFYNNFRSEQIAMDNATRIKLVHDPLTTKAEGDRVVVSVFCDKTGAGEPFATYTVTVVARLVQSVAISTEPTKKNYRYGETLQLKGLVASVTYADSKVATFTAISDFVDPADRIAKVKFEITEAGVATKTEDITLQQLLSGKSTIMTASEDIVLDFYGKKATFHVLVLARTINGIYILSTAAVKTEMIKGNDYASIAGLRTQIKYTDNSTEVADLTASNTKRITAAEVSAIATAGWYWYTEGSMSEVGIVRVTVLYAYQNQKNVMATYPASYDVRYNNATLLSLNGIRKLEGGVYTEVQTLGNQPKGLTPYFKDYFIAGYYDDAIVRFIPISFPMTDYDIKNVTEGIRPVILSYAGLQMQTQIQVDSAQITSVVIGTAPRKNYVYTEALSLTGGTLIRNFKVSDTVTRQDSVDMKEAEFSFPAAQWPTTFESFAGAVKIVVEVQLSYEGFTMSFKVDVYPPQDLEVVIVSTINYYGHVTEPTVQLKQILPEFLLPTYTMRFTNADGSPLANEGVPKLDANGNTIYPCPKVVKQGNYRVIATSSGNRYYNSVIKNEEFSVSPLAVELRPNYISKIYGESDPALTYKISEQSYWDEALKTVPLTSGRLVRVVGENVGEYGISISPVDPFVHPYFTVSFVMDGRFEVRPKLVETELKTDVLFYKKGADGGAEDQKSKIAYYFNFVNHKNGVKSIVKQTDFEGKPTYPNYYMYQKYLTELSTIANYTYRIESRKDNSGAWSEAAQIAEKGLYGVRVTILPALGVTQNYQFNDQTRPNDGVGGNWFDMTLTVRAEPWTAPNVGNLVEFLSTDEENEAVLESMVHGKDFDILVTNKYVYVWKYRLSQWSALHPEGEYFAYTHPDIMKGQWKQSYKIAKSDLYLDKTSYLQLKFVTNGDDKAESAISNWIFTF